MVRSVGKQAIQKINFFFIKRKWDREKVDTFELVKPSPTSRSQSKPVLKDATYLR